MKFKNRRWHRLGIAHCAALAARHAGPADRLGDFAGGMGLQRLPGWQAAARQGLWTRRHIVLGIVGGFVGSLLVTLFGITGLVKLPFIGGILVGALGSAVVVVVAGLLGDEGGGE